MKGLVLVVDDNPISCNILRVAIQRMGYTVDMAESSTEALMLCDKTNYTLILMDYRLPDLDGVQTAKKILAKSATPAPFIVAVSASAGPDEGTIDVDRYIIEWLKKPIGLQKLEDTVNNYLNSSTQKKSKAG